MPCFTANVVDNQILFGCFITKLEDDNQDPSKHNHFNALLDTGAQLSGITQKVVDELQLTPVSWVDISGVSGVVNTPTYIVDIGIAVSELSHQPSGVIQQSVMAKMFERRQVSLLDFGQNAQFDVLIGMDIIVACHVSIHTGNLFTICV